VHHDFSSTVVRFLQLAVKDPDVLAIKHTMYRTNRSSPVIQALMAAAEMGKQVVCLVEIKARFDEQNNMKWARALEKAGVHVMYGPPELKIHSKLAMVVRRESNRTRRYVHIGTGNYNPSTAKIYSDFGLFTCQDDITADIANLFNHLTGFSKPPTFSRLLVSPHYMREGIFKHIRSVTEQSRNGRVGCCIQIKCNSILDGPAIEMLYLASRAGVQVQIISRGITALLPGVEGASENIRVVSVVGRLLEHARVYIFHYGKGLESKYFIGSADLMPRNLDRRIEVLAPLDDPQTQKQVQWVINTQLRDTALAWELGPNKTWKCIRQHINGSQALIDSQSAALQTFGNSRKLSKL